eukprot:jgi/Chlat1/2822/Chrsp187S02921
MTRPRAATAIAVKGKVVSAVGQTTLANIVGFRGCNLEDRHSGGCVQSCSTILKDLDSVLLKWSVEIRGQMAARRVCLGTYGSAEEAAALYDAAVGAVCKPNAKANFPADPRRSRDVGSSGDDPFI